MKRGLLASTLMPCCFIVLSAATCWTSPAIAQQKGHGPSQSALVAPQSGNLIDTAQTGSADGKAEDLAHAIRDLASTSFQSRQAAYEKLVATGDSAIHVLESGAKTNQSEVATRCVEALAQIARDGKNAKVALAALQRLAADSTHRSSREAVHVVKDLKTTNEDRAIAALTAEGVRIHRGARNREIFSLHLERDGQLAYVKHLSTVRYISLSHQDITDVGIEYLAHAKQLTSLTIVNTSVTDAGLRRLDQLSKLEHLSLAGQFTSEGLCQLHRIKSLRALMLLSAIDNRDLEFLVFASHITTLSLSEVHLNEELVDIINRCRHLRSCSLSVTNANDIQLQLVGQLEVPIQLSLVTSPNITESGWKQLEGTRLNSLCLMQTPITDAALIHIGAIPMLHSLMIYNSPISDAGLIHLAQLKSLRTLMLRDTNVTDDGIKILRRSLPNLRYFSLR